MREGGKGGTAGSLKRTRVMSRVSLVRGCMHAYLVTGTGKKGRRRGGYTPVSGFYRDK